MDLPLIDIRCRLEKFPGKGGWTYARLPGIVPDKRNPFGWIRVRGSIDACIIKQYHLMPMGNGELFLPVKAAIRKKINKQEGDEIHVVLFRDDSPLEIPEDFLLCLHDEPKAFQTFFTLTEKEKKIIVDNILAVRKTSSRDGRIAATINELLRR